MTQYSGQVFRMNANKNSNSAVGKHPEIKTKARLKLERARAWKRGDS